MPQLACVGGPRHRQLVPAGPTQFTAPDGTKYRNVGFKICGRRNRFYVHDSIYNDIRQRHRFAVEVHFEMTWQEPSQAGFYWVRWKQDLTKVTIMDSGVTNAGRSQLWRGTKPADAKHRHALWSLSAIPAPALELMRQDDVHGILVAADWCSEHDYAQHAEHFRQLAEQL